jgi:phosphoribosyl 1,2-cyclic phosphate phosphodiesterase
MRITFLGTGTSHGVPMIGCACATCRSADPRDTRLRPSIFIETADTNILVDAGPDLRAQALTHHIDRVDAILFTHGHADHILGMDDLRRFNTLQRAAMACYGDDHTLSDIRRTFGYVFDPATPGGGGLPQLELFRVMGPFSALAHRSAQREGGLPPQRSRHGSSGIEIQPIRILHGRRPILGYRLGAFAYLTDCSAIPDESWPLLTGLDVLVLDALRERVHPTHFSLSEATSAAQRIGATRTFFTHMCHDLPHAATCERLPAGVTLAYDGLVVEC